MNKMIENKIKALTHIRIHSDSRFVMSLDMNIPTADVIQLLVEYMNERENPGSVQE